MDYKDSELRSSRTKLVQDRFLQATNREWNKRHEPDLKVHHNYDDRHDDDYLPPGVSDDDFSHDEDEDADDEDDVDYRDTPYIPEEHMRPTLGNPLVADDPEEQSFDVAMNTSGIYGENGCESVNDRVINERLNIFDQQVKLIRDTGNWDTNYRATSHGYQGLNYEPYPNYTMFMLSVMQHRIGISRHDMGLICDLLKHPDFNPAHIPNDPADIMKQCNNIRTVGLYTSEGGKEAHVDIKEVLQRWILASPLFSKYIRHEPHEVWADKERHYTNVRSTDYWRQLHPASNVKASQEPGAPQFKLGDILMVKQRMPDNQTVQHMGMLVDLRYRGFGDEHDEYDTPYDYESRNVACDLELLEIDNLNTMRIGNPLVSACTFRRNVDTIVRIRSLDMKLIDPQVIQLILRRGPEDDQGLREDKEYQSAEGIKRYVI